MRDVRRRNARRPRRLAWVPGAAAFAALLVLLGLLDGQWAPVAANAGRVEMVGNTMGQVEFVSSQAHPANEYLAMTTKVLHGFNGTPDFYSQASGSDDIARIRYEHAAGHSTIDVV